MLNFYFAIELQILYSILILCIILYIIPMTQILKIVMIIFYLLLMSKTFLTHIEMIKAYFALQPRKEQHLFHSIYAPKIFRYMSIKDNFSRLPERNTLILANYPAQRLEYMLQGLFPRELCLVTSDRAKSFVSLIYPEEQLILLPDGHKNFKKTKQMIREKIKDYSIFSYINDNSTRLGEYHCGKMRKGLFYIAHKLNIPITPVAISHIEPICGVIINQTIHIRVGPTTLITDPLQSMTDTRQFLQNNLTRFRDL
jgi:hypothetical protein